MAFWKNREAVLGAVQRDWRALAQADVSLRGDREIVTEAVRQRGMALQWASPELRGDREIVLQAVRMTGQALRYASKELRADREVVLEAVTEVGLALKYAAKELQNSPELMLQAVRMWGDQALEALGASDELKTEPLLKGDAPRLNPLAVPGAQGVICIITEMDKESNDIKFRASVGLGGTEKEFTLHSGATVRSLAAQFRENQALRPRQAIPYIHLVMPGSGAVSPFDVDKPLVAFF